MKAEEFFVDGRTEELVIKYTTEHLVDQFC